MTILIIILIYLAGLIFVPAFAIKQNEKMMSVDENWNCIDTKVKWIIGLFWPISIFYILGISLTCWWNNI